jgi:hypothetical protein
VLEMFEKLLSILNALQVYYEQITPNEIIIPCPANCAPEELLLQSQDKLLEDNRVGCITDEAYIHITNINNRLNWLIVMDWEQFIEENED